MAATSARSGGRRRSPGGRDRALLADAKRRGAGPVVAAGAAVGGLAAGTALGARLRAHRRPHVLGLPLPRSGEMRSGARKVARAGRRLYDLESDVRALREQADSTRRQSPIEVVLSALTSRRLPRKA